jgi:DNA-binding NarL/FixJ family response regulator
MVSTVNYKPKVMIVDDHEFFRTGLALAIKRLKFVELHFEAVDGQDFLHKQKEDPGDIVLMDIMLPKLGGYETVVESKRLFPQLKIIILTMREDDDQISKFLEIGVHGYLLKNIDQHLLEIALKAVIEGQNYYSKEVMSYVTRQLNANQNNKNRREQLSRRELEILQLIFDGLSDQEIANKIFVSIRTVTNHRYNLRIKTSAKNTAGLISYGLKHKLIK